MQIHIYCMKNNSFPSYANYKRGLISAYYILLLVTVEHKSSNFENYVKKDLS